MDQQKCKQKLTFETKEDAWAAVALAKWRYETGKLKVYRCHYCKQWHIATDIDED